MIIYMNEDGAMWDRWFYVDELNRLMVYRHTSKLSKARKMHFNVLLF